MTQEDLSSINELKEHWPEFDHSTRVEKFANLSRWEAEELFLALPPADQVDLLADYNANQRRSWVRLLAPDDAADLIQNLPIENRNEYINLLDAQAQKEVLALLAYSEDDAGGLMNPRYIRLRPEMAVEEAIRYLRVQARMPIETIYYAYVLDPHQVLLGTVSFRELLLAPPGKIVKDLMQTDLVTVSEEMDQEEVGRLFSSHDLMAIPVVDKNGGMKGIVTMDDVMTVMQQEVTEDIQKLGAVQVLDSSYFKTGFFEMIRKRAGWLTVLFIGESLTFSTLQHFESEIQSAVILALFIPLIISSGGNSGSQASTLIIRALALREIRLRDWWRVLQRELATGFALGCILGLIGMLRVLAWPGNDPALVNHSWVIAQVVAVSLVGVVLWGATIGAMLPFLLRRLKLDPATASAPFVATMVDVTGLMIYFTVAGILLKGHLL